MLKSSLALMISLSFYVQAFENEVKISKSSGQRIITSNGIPNHKTGKFPGRGNPHAITEQKIKLRVPLKPKKAKQAKAIGMNYFGVALNGVVMDPAAAEWWKRDRSSGWQYEAITPKEKKLGVDLANGHVQPNGSYHYHGLPEILHKMLKSSRKGMTLIGWAADGYPIYAPYGYKNRKALKGKLKELKSSYQNKKGARKGTGGTPRGKHEGTLTQDEEDVKGSGDLDAQNGRYGVTPEFPKGTYYYVLTKSYPYIPRFHRGIADKSFTKKRGGGRNGPPGGRGQRPF